MVSDGLAVLELVLSAQSDETKASEWEAAVLITIFFVPSRSFEAAKGMVAIGDRGVLVLGLDDLRSR